MKRYRVAIERKYTDVSIQFVDAETDDEARAQALRLAREESPASDFHDALFLNIIEIDDVRPDRNR